jgi:hypothetical protein
MKTTTTLPHIAFAVCLLAPACTLQKTDDIAEYREALPQAQHVRVAGPEHSEAGSSTAGAQPGSGLLSAGNGTPGVARWYAFTRGVRDGVNLVTRNVLGSVWLVVHTKPTRVGEDYAEWGPYTDALDPATYRFRVERVAPHTFEYRLDGRPRASSAEADYRPVLYGNGFGRLDSRHGDGGFTIDLEVAKALDPLKHAEDSGTVSITHDLPSEITRELGALPRTITADVRPKGATFTRIVSVANEDFTGTLDVDAHADIDDSKATLPEDVSLQSRWRADGQGRSDITIAGGDLPAETPLVTATECWGTDFGRVYYADSVDFEETFGEAGACAYDAPSK